MSQCEAATTTHMYRDGAPVLGPRCRLSARVGYTRCHVHDDRPRDYAADLRKADAHIRRALDAARDGKWVPSPSMTALLHFVGAAIKDSAR